MNQLPNNLIKGSKSDSLESIEGGVKNGKLHIAYKGN